MPFLARPPGNRGLSLPRGRTSPPPAQAHGLPTLAVALPAQQRPRPLLGWTQGPIWERRLSCLSSGFRQEGGGGKAVYCMVPNMMMRTIYPSWQYQIQHPHQIWHLLGKVATTRLFLFRTPIPNISVRKSFASSICVDE